MLVVVFQSLSCVQLCVTQWIAARQASLSFTMSQSLLKFMSIESMMPSNHLILCHPIFLLTQSCSASGSFPVSWLFASGGQSIGVCTSASVLLMNIQGWFPLGLTGLISLQSKWFLRIFSSTITVHKLQFFSAQPCLWSISHIHTLLLIALAVWTCGHICFLNMLSRFIKLCLINAKKEVSESKRESKVHKQYRVEYGT